MVYLLKCNIQSHKFMESFSYEDGLMKIRGLGEYLKKEQAIAYAYKIMKKIEGFLWVYPHKYNGEKRFYLSVIVVSEKYRKKRIGSLMYQAAMEEIIQRGINKIYTHVDAENSISLRMHYKLGFKDEVYQFVKQEII